MRYNALLVLQAMYRKLGEEFMVLSVALDYTMMPVGMGPHGCIYRGLHNEFNIQLTDRFGPTECTLHFSGRHNTSDILVL